MVKILTAETDTGELVSLIQDDREERMNWKALKLCCPICHKPVHLRTGNIRMAHFAHKAYQKCEYSAEKETEEHLLLKRILAEWCLEAKIDCQLEAYLPKLKQRPDLLIGNMAVEIQCSTLAPEKMMKRTHTYLKHGYQPIWICGKKLWCTEKLKESTKQYCNYSKELGFHIWTADWETEELILCYHLEEDIEKRLYYGKRSWPFYTGRLDGILSKTVEKRIVHMRSYQLKSELTKNYQLLTRKLYSKERNTLKDQAYFYERYLHLLKLHPWFYYSINQSFIFKSSTFILRHQIWEWLMKRRERRISKIDIYKAVYDFIIKLDILYDFPLIFKGDLVEWYVCYLIEGLLTFDLLRKEKDSTDFFVIIDTDEIPDLKSERLFKGVDGDQVIKTGTPLKV